MTRPQPEEDTRKFTPDTVKELLSRSLKGSYKRPDKAGRHRLADAFNRIYEREVFGEAHDSPHMFWHAGANPPSGEAIRVRWHRFVRATAEIIQTELTQANFTPVGLSDDGPVARAVVEVIYMITGEKPSGASVIRELRRQQEQ
jgi:hypothetical protein